MFGYTPKFSNLENFESFMVGGLIRVYPRARRAFPCDACGECCQNVHASVDTKYLERGDRVCKNLNNSNELCEIYDDRPLVCRVQSTMISSYLNL
ncbi:YkgJ family cysteine cluster protein [Vibrio vulnificus]|nr:YkgJ family cysteine cluster protein [Vibrio vulnificus]